MLIHLIFPHDSKHHFIDHRPVLAEVNPFRCSMYRVSWNGCSAWEKFWLRVETHRLSGLDESKTLGNFSRKCAKIYRGRLSNKVVLINIIHKFTVWREYRGSYCHTSTVHGKVFTSMQKNCCSATMRAKEYEVIYLLLSIHLSGLVIFWQTYVDFITMAAILKIIDTSQTSWHHNNDDSNKNHSIDNSYNDSSNQHCFKNPPDL